MDDDFDVVDEGDLLEPRRCSPLEPLAIPEPGWAPPVNGGAVVTRYKPTLSGRNLVLLFMLPGVTSSFTALSAGIRCNKITSYHRPHTVQLRKGVGRHHQFMGFFVTKVWVFGMDGLVMTSPSISR